MTTLGCDWMIALQAPKGVKERVKSPYRNTSMYRLNYDLRTSNTHTHFLPPFVLRARVGVLSYIQRSTIGQSVFCIFLMVAGCYILYAFASLCVTCFAMLRDDTLRPVLKHGPRSSTGLRVVEFISHNALIIHGEAKAKSYEVKLTTLLQYRLITYRHRAFCLCVYAHFGKRVIKLKSNLVETRKMVNFARTWWSQVKTWWKLALCGTDVQIVAAWSG